MQASSVDVGRHHHCRLLSSCVKRTRRRTSVDHCSAKNTRPRARAVELEENEREAHRCFVQRGSANAAVAHVKCAVESVFTSLRLAVEAAVCQILQAAHGPARLGDAGISALEDQGEKREKKKKKKKRKAHAIMPVMIARGGIVSRAPI